MEEAEVVFFCGSALCNMCDHLLGPYSLRGHRADNSPACVFDGDGTVYVADRGAGAIYSFAGNLGSFRYCRRPLEFSDFSKNSKNDQNHVFWMGLAHFWPQIRILRKKLHIFIGSNQFFIDFQKFKFFQVLFCLFFYICAVFRGLGAFSSNAA